MFSLGFRLQKALVESEDIRLLSSYSSAHHEYTFYFMKESAEFSLKCKLYISLWSIIHFISDQCTNMTKKYSLEMEDGCKMSKT